jgi:amino acid transporter
LSIKKSIVFTTCVHGLAPKWGIAIQNALSLMKIAMLMLVLVTGIIAATGLTSMPRASNYANTFTGTTSDANAYATALLNAFFTFDGWNNLNYSLDELIDPIKNLPRASMSAVAITGTLYTTAVISYFLVIPIDQIDTKTAILGGQFFTMTMGATVGQRIIPVLIGLSSFGSVMCTTFGASRITRSAALEGYFPCAGFFGKLNKQGAPIGGLTLHLCVTLVLMLGPPPGEIYSFLINLAAYPAYIFYGLTVVGLLVLRIREPDTPRPFKSYWIPNVLFVAMCVFLTFFPFVPPAGPATSSIPYYLHALIGISWLVLCMPWWYLQVIIFGGKKKAAEKMIDNSVLAGSGSPKKSNTDHVMDVVHSYSPTLFSEDDSKLVF